MAALDKWQRKPNGGRGIKHDPLPMYGNVNVILFLLDLSTINIEQ